MTARFLPVRGKAEKSLCTLTTEYTAHLIHSFCCSERASHTSGRTITVKTAGCFLLAEKYYSVDAGKILFSEYSRNIRNIYCIVPSGLGHCRGSAVGAMTGRGDNDTSVQPQTHAMGAVTREPRDGGIPMRLHKPTIVRCVPITAGNRG